MNGDLEVLPMRLVWNFRCLFVQFCAKLVMLLDLETYEMEKLIE